MKKLIVIALVLLACTACTKTDETERVLHSQGFTDVDITGYRFFGCSDRDYFHTGFTATSPNGNCTEGVVCSGIFKGATIRFD